MKLGVYRNNIKVGLLDILANEPFFGFTYTDDYLFSPGALPLSISLPLTGSRYPGRLAQPYFEGLLPEGEARDAISRRLGVPLTSSVKLLQALGYDCAGDVTIIDESNNPPVININAADAFQYIPLDGGLSNIAQKPREEIPRLLEDMRLSLAGGQNKIALYHNPDDPINEGWYIPSLGAPSTHIIKPGLLEAYYPDVTLNEFLCLRAAAACGIQTAEADLLFPETPIIIIKRYDRKIIDETINGFMIPSRVHQEDFCQACGVISSSKYEYDGGPGYKQIRNLLSKYSKHPYEDILTFVKWGLYNYLIGNCDAHAKNLSILYNPDGTVSLSPAYDLICSTVYDGNFGSKLNRGMAMKIGAHENIDKINTDDIKIFAGDVHIRFQQVKSIGTEIVEKLTDALKTAVIDAEAVGFNRASMLAERIIKDSFKRAKVIYS